jgi:uncharacterized membrane protein YcfT
MTVMTSQRIGWVDYSKGICIILVVMMHSTLDYGAMVGDTGWMHAAVGWTKPFRMPDFFLISGLFLSRSIFGSKIDYFDRKFLHFAYFYCLWLFIQTLAFDANVLLSNPWQFMVTYLSALVIPKSSLWFIHQLAVFYMFTWAVRKVPQLWVFLAAAALQIAFSTQMIDTGWSVTNRFMEWFVFFYGGYWLAPRIFAFAEYIQSNRAVAWLALAGWAVTNTVFTQFEIDGLPILSLALGFAGAFAIAAIGALLAQANVGNTLRYVGQNSIVIYLTFFLPMKVLQKAFVTAGPILDVGTASAIITLVAVFVPLIFHRMILKTPLIALYERPGFMRLKGPKGSRKGGQLLAEDPLMAPIDPAKDTESR